MKNLKFQSVFDIIGPVMVGPSSSHTAGAVRIGKIVAAIIGGGLLHLVGGQQVNMLVLAGVLLIIGAVCVHFITETFSTKS